MIRNTAVVAVISLLAFQSVVTVRETSASLENGAEFAQRRVPFVIGEEHHFRLHAKFLLLSGGGTASLAVEGIDNINSFPSYRLVLNMKGGLTIFRIDDVHRSWLDTLTLFSRRYEQKLKQTGYSRDRTLDFRPNLMDYVLVTDTTRTGVLASPEPLDDISFIYHVRSLPLTDGATYTSSRYFKAENNPITVTVVRREKITVPAGTFNAVVVQPASGADGLFRKKGDALVWLSDDDRRLVLRIRAKVGAPTMTMELESYRLGAGEPLLPQPADSGGPTASERSSSPP